MAEDKSMTTKQEMKELGIKSEYFDTFYGKLIEDKKLPSGDIVPLKQYTTIVNYLRDKKVLGEDNKIQLDGFEVFNSKRRLEKIIDFKDLSNHWSSRNSGGIAPCRDRHENSGGIAPCR